MIGRRSLLILLNNVLGGFLGFFALRFILALPKEAFGAYAWASSTVGIAALLTSLGFREAHIKRVNEGRDEAHANGTFFLIKIVLTTLFTVVVLGSYLFWKLVLGRGFTDATTEPIFVATCAIYILLSLRQFFDTVFLTHQHTARAESVLLIDTLASVASVVLAWTLWAISHGASPPLGPLVDPLLEAWEVQGPIGPDQAGLLVAVAYLVGRAVSLLYAAAQFMLHAYPLGRPQAELYQSYKSLGFPLAIVSGLTVLYANIDRFFLGYFHTKEEVARFSAPLQILTPMLFVSTAVSTLLFPQISRLDARGDHGRIRDDVQRSERYMSMLLIPMLVLAFVFASEGINLFNQQYVDQADVLRVLLLYVFFGVLASPSRTAMLGLGRPKRLLRLGVINVVLVTVLILLLVPDPTGPNAVPWGMGLQAMGAAIAAGAASIVTYLYVKRETRDVVGHKVLPPGLFRQLVAGLGVFLLAWVARDTLGPDVFLRWWQLGLAAAAFGIIYLGLLVALKEFKRSDWDFFVDLLHPGKMAGYVGRELNPKGKQ